MPIILCFLAEAVAHKYTIGSIEGTLSAVADHHQLKSGGMSKGPTHSFVVKRALQGVRKILGSTSQGHPLPAIAIPTTFMRALLYVTEKMAWKAARRGDFRQAFGHTRDGWYYASTFIVALRKEESMDTCWGDITESKTEPDKSGEMFIRKSKTDQLGVGVSIPFAWRTDSGLDIRRSLELHKQSYAALGLNWRKCPIFGRMDDPTTRLASASSIIQRLNLIYFKEIENLGVQLSEDFKLSGHSFRRGGINAIRDAARAKGISDDQLKMLLMRFGRWRDERSVLVYLVENMQELLKLTQRL